VFQAALDRALTDAEEQLLGTIGTLGDHQRNELGAALLAIERATGPGVGARG
jgi:hypothetical protein